MSFLVPTQRGLEQASQPTGDFSSIHNQPNRSRLPLPPFADDPMSQSLPKVGQTRCYWSLLSSELDFVYLDPVLANHLETQADLLIGKSLLSFVHPEEQATARADLAEALERRTMHGSVTRVRYCRLSRVRRILGHQGPTQPWPDGDKVSVDAYYMVVDIVIHWAAEGLVLCFIHAVVDLEPGDNDEHHRTPWTNWCGTPCMHPDQITLLQQRLLYYLPQSTATTRVFQILFNSNYSQQDCRLLLSWPSDSSQEYPGMPGAKDFARRVVGIQTSTRDNNAKTSCTRCWRIQDTMPGIGEVESVFIPHGSITFACHTVQQPQPFTRSTDPYMPAHSQHHPYDLSASPYTLPPVSTSVPQYYGHYTQSYGHYTQSVTSQYSHSPWGSYPEPSSSLSQFNRWPAQSPAHSMASLPSSSCTLPESPYSRPSPSPIYGENRASLSNYQATPSPEDYSTKAGFEAFEASVPPAPPCGTDIVPPRHRVSPGTHKDTLPRSTNNRPVGVLKCSSCKATSSPEWRKGPSGRKELCNACGLRYARSRARKEGHAVSTQRRKKDKTGAVTANEESAVPSTYPIPIAGGPWTTRRGAPEGSTFSSPSSVGSGSGSEPYSQPSPVAPEDNRPSPSPSLSGLNFSHYHPSRPSSGPSHHQPRTDSIVPPARYFRSSGSPSSSVSIGHSYSSDSISSTVSMGYPYFPPSSPSPQPSASRPIAIKKLFSLDDDGFQSSPSPKDWDVPSRSPYETYEFSHSPQTPDELPRSWQSSDSRTRLSSQAMRHGYYHSQHVHQYDDNRTCTNATSSRLSSNASLHLSSTPNPQTPLAHKNTPRQMSTSKSSPSSARPWPIPSPLVREKECNNLIPHVRSISFCFSMSLIFFLHHETIQPQTELLPNISTSPSPEATATVEEASRELVSNSLEDFTYQLQGRSSFPTACGGFGDIWKCILVRANRNVDVAVKTIRASKTDNEETMHKKARRVRRELKVWARLKHHSIIPLWGVANDFGPYPAMICPWADNGAITGFLERQQDKLSSLDNFSLLNDIALGLEYLHSKSVVHGDLTGSNVLIDGNGRACLADFGLSTVILEFIGTSYFTSSIQGHVRWVDAELYEASEDDEVSLSPECDIYSFGSIILQESDFQF
ncbi:hypothetical protein F4604DRAFT_1138525 [Suillus subluteus]|nr:hypothetical protein F4604DRAFT_1138525 [Suillus subluteus]